MTSSMGSELAEANPELAISLTSGIKEGDFHGNIVWVRSCIIAGMILTIEAFDIESGFRLLQRFGEIRDEKDLKMIKDLVVKSLGEKKEMDPFDAALQMPKIPFIQISLNEIIAKVAREDRAYGRHIKKGAAVMYAVLLEFKSKLFPPNQNPPTPPTGNSGPSSVSQPPSL